jgi:hypothetical protein
MGKTGTQTLRRSAAALAIGMAASLSACGGSQDISKLLVAPGKYDIYTCPQIADRMHDVDEQDKKLEGLMARAGQGTGGDFVNDIAYEPDYLANRGEMRELRKSAAAKNCPSVPPSAATTSAAPPATPGTPQAPSSSLIR